MPARSMVLDLPAAPRAAAAPQLRVAGVARALPEHRYPQAAITAALAELWRGRLERPELLERLHARAGVAHRHLAFPLERYAGFRSWGETNAAWLEVAQTLGEQALDRALARAGVTRRDLDALFVVSITGVASPSLDARLINRMGLRRDIKRTPIFGVGCVGGALGLSRAADYVLAHPEGCAALLSVELCSLTLQRDDRSTTNLVSTGLFGDGAAAVIVTGAQRAALPVYGLGERAMRAGPVILGTGSVFYRESEDVMGWDISERGFEIVLSPRLPDLIRANLARDVDGFLARFGLVRGDIGSWVIHTGGPKILHSVQSTLGLPERALERSWASLREVGNLSSASVLLVLEDTLEQARPAAGTLGLLLAMGPGFCSELILLRW